MFAAFLVVVTASAAIQGGAAEPTVADALLAERDRLEEDFGEPPPPPPPLEGDPADEPGEAPAPLPPLDEDAAPAPAGDDGDEERAGEPKEQKDGAMSPLFVGMGQYAAGLGTLTACTGAGCLAGFLGMACLYTCASALFFTSPIVVHALWSLVFLATATASGAVVGLVDTAIGNLLAGDEGSWIYPAAAGAGAGFATMGAFSALYLANIAMSPWAAAPNPTPAFNYVGPCGPLFGCLSFALCGAFCLGVPGAAAAAYAFTKTTLDAGPAPEEVERGSAEAPAAPRLARLAHGPMAF